MRTLYSKGGAKVNSFAGNVMQGMELMPGVWAGCYIGGSLRGDQRGCGITTPDDVTFQVITPAGWGCDESNRFTLICRPMRRI